MAKFTLDIWDPTTLLILLSHIPVYKICLILLCAFEVPVEAVTKLLTRFMSCFFCIRCSMMTTNRYTANKVPDRQAFSAFACSTKPH